MDKALRIVDGAPDAGATTALDLFRAAPGEASAVFYFDATSNLCRAGSPQRSARGLALGTWRRQRRPRRDCPSEYTAVSHRGSGRVEARGDRRQSQSDVSHARTQQAFRGLRRPGLLSATTINGTPSSPRLAPSIPELVLWTSGREFQTRNNSRVLRATVGARAASANPGASFCRGYARPGELQRCHRTTSPCCFIRRARRAFQRARC